MTAERTFQQVATKSIDPHPDNPRVFSKTVDRGVAEMAKSIKKVGVLEPLLVRQAGKRFQLIAGERRLRGSKRARISEVPCLVYTTLSDEDALELMAIENLEREDLSPIEEAASIELLLEQPGWDLEAVADRLGRSPRWVAERRRLVNLAPCIIREAAADPDHALSTWSAAHFRALAVLEPAAQEAFFAARDQERWEKPFFKTAKQLREEVERELLLLASAPWKLGDAELVPKAGACDACPKRSSSQPGLFDDGADPKDRCLDPVCFSAKLEALVLERYRALREEHGDKLVIVREWSHGSEDKVALTRPPKRLADRVEEFWRFDEVRGKADRAPLVALFAAGPRAGQVVGVRRTSSASSGSTTRTGAKTLEEKEAALLKRRHRFAAQQAFDELLAGKKPPEMPAPEIVVGLAAAFGTSSRFSGFGAPRYGVGQVSWTSLFRRFKELEPGLEMLWRRVCRRLAIEISNELKYGPDSAWRDVKGLCKALGIPHQPYWKAALKKYPVPKAWAKELELRAQKQAEEKEASK